MKNLIVALVLAGAAPTQVHAIATRHDVADAKYIVAEADFPAVFPLDELDGMKACGPTVIDEQWAITAAHCLVAADTRSTPDGFPVTVAGQERYISEIHIHPNFGIDYDTLLEFMPLTSPEDEEALLEAVGGIENFDYYYDIALLKFSEPLTDVAPIPLYSGDEFIGQAVELVGWGFLGTGDKGIADNADFADIYDGNLRRAQNKVSKFEGSMSVLHFDRPGTEDVMPLEGVPAPNDSGGPIFVTAGGQRHLLGVNSSATYGDSLDDIFSVYRPIGQYGQNDYFVRISAVRDWIDNTVSR